MLFSLRIGCLLALFIAQAVAQGEHEVNKGKFPYMAFIYYPDETGVISTNRFFRSAILIRVNWLVSSSLDYTSSDKVSLGFPKKTLLARIGAITIDDRITLNEDEDEQESEVIQVVRPHKHSVEKWWETDISLLKTLAPFNVTNVVSPMNSQAKVDFFDKKCSILVFSKNVGNSTDKVLMQLYVGLLLVEECKHEKKTATMACSNTNDAIYPTDFCQGNSGGPVICEGEVMGTQTYIDNCNTPFLYQMLSSWDNFINCGVEEKCNEEHCSKLCDVTDKDPSINAEENNQNFKNLSTEVNLEPSQSSYVVEVFTQPSEETESINSTENEIATENEISAETETTSTTSTTTTSTTERTTVEISSELTSEETTVTKESVVQVMTEGRRKAASEREKEPERKPVLRKLTKHKKSSGDNLIVMPLLQITLIIAILGLVN